MSRSSSRVPLQASDPPILFERPFRGIVFGLGQEVLSPGSHADKTPRLVPGQQRQHLGAVDILARSRLVPGDRLPHLVAHHPVAIDKIALGHYPQPCEPLVLRIVKTIVEQGDAHPFPLDSRPPSIPLRDFVASEARFAILERSDPERARHLLTLAQADAEERWRFYQQMAEVERTVSHEEVEEGPTGQED